MWTATGIAAATYPLARTVKQVAVTDAVDDAVRIADQRTSPPDKLARHSAVVRVRGATTAAAGCLLLSMRWSARTMQAGEGSCRASAPRRNQMLTIFESACAHIYSSDVVQSGNQVMCFEIATRQ